MTKSETTKILTIIRAFYKTDQNAAEMVGAWHTVLADYDYEVAEVAVKNFAKNDKRDYATFPPLGKIVQQIEMLMPENKIGIDLWRIAERQIKRGTVITQEEFDELPAPIKRYFGGVSAIRDLALLDMDQLPNERARFLNNIERIIDQEKARKNLPPKVAEAIDGLAKKLEYKKQEEELC